jgi:DNA-binding NarL/FixJ family response regulator
MLHLTFSQEDIKELDDQRYHHPHPRVQRKMEALLLKAKGLPHHQIASCVGVCENTVRSYAPAVADRGHPGPQTLGVSSPRKPTGDSP